MATVQARTYDYPVAVTKSDTASDPGGPFTGLYVDTGGVLKFTPYNGPNAGTSITINVTTGTELHWPVQRVWSSVTTAVVFGLVSPVVQQGV